MQNCEKENKSQPDQYRSDFGAGKGLRCGEIFGPDGNEQRDQCGSCCGLQYVAGNQSDLLIDKNLSSTRTTADMKAFMNGYMSALYQKLGQDLKLVYSQAKATVTYKNFNKAATFTIPKECR